MEPDALVYEDKLKNLQETFGVSAEDTQLDVLEETQGEPERVSTPMSRKEESPVKSTVTQPALAPKNLL